MTEEKPGFTENEKSSSHTKFEESEDDEVLVVVSGSDIVLTQSIIIGFGVVEFDTDRLAKHEGF
jgi:hypothetical protein